MNDQTQPIDQTALNLSRAIRKAEGGDYENMNGDNNTSAGAYQFNNGKLPLKKGDIPANFKSWAQELNLDPNDFSQENQDHVAYAKIKKDLDGGLTQSQIAAKWNSGLTHGWENHKGTTTINGKTISYDTPGYVDKVKAEYERLSNGGSVDGGNDGNSQKGVTFDDLINNQRTQQVQQPTQEPGIMENLSKGNIGGALMKGINDITSPFAGVAAIPVQAGVKAYNGLTGSNIPDPFSKEGGNTSGLGVTPLTIQDKGSDLLKAGSTAATVASAGGLMGALKGASFLEGPAIEGALTKAGYPSNTISSILKSNPSAKLDAFTEALNDAPASARGVIQKAIEQIQPLADKEAGLLPSTLKKMATTGGKVALKVAKGLGKFGLQAAGLGEAAHLYNKYVK